VRRRGGHGAVGDCRTFADPVTRFQAPDDALVDVLVWLCWEGEILLRPQLLLGASTNSSLKPCSDGLGLG
jgi:hypothetical protein